MKFYIGANKAGSREHATEWLQHSHVLSELEGWGRWHEGKWGECFFFLEVSVPLLNPTSNRNQLDFVVSFDERCAIGEMKRNPTWRAINLRNLIDQVELQEKTFASLLRSGGLSPDFGCVAFFPALKASDLVALKQSIGEGGYSRPDLRLAGARAELRDRASDGKVYHLEFALDSCLNSKTSGRRADLSGTQTFLRDLMTTDGLVLDERDDAESLIASLKQFNRSPFIAFPKYYVEDSHQKDAKSALDYMRQRGVVELVGPPGIGKSILASELIVAVGGQAYALKCEIGGRRGRKPTYSDIGRLFDELIEGAPDRLLPDDEVIPRLASKPAILWIQYYDDDCRSAVRDFLVKFGLTAQEVRRAYCIVESRRSLDSSQEFQVDVSSMDRPHIASLLRQIPPGRQALHLEKILDDSLGNPGTAIRLWTASGLSEEDTGEFGWFMKQLNAAEKRVLAAITYAVRDSPFGLSRPLVDSFVGVACADLTHTIREGAVRRVLELVSTEQLGDTTTFSASQFAGLLSDVAPPNEQLQVVHRIDAGLTKTLLENLDGDRTAAWRDLLVEVLADESHRGSLAESTLYLLFEGNLEPFFRSSFRYTFLGGLILDWLDGVGFEPKSSTQAYILRGMRVLAALRRGITTELEVELGPPGDGAIQRFVYEFVAARKLGTEGLPSDFDFAHVLKHITETPDPDLRAVHCSSCAAALQAVGRTSEAWLLLTNTQSGLESGSSASTLVWFETASFINRETGRKFLESIHESRAEWMKKCSQALVRSGLQSQNIRLVAEGVFFHIRCAEFAKRPSTFDEVLSYRAAFDWLERVPSPPARWRMRTLLTRGSIHRHYLEENRSLPWTEFAPHLRLAWADYQRAFHCARGRHTFHALNALSYMVTLCLSGMKYCDDSDAREEVLVLCREASECCAAVRELNIAGKDEQRIWLNIDRAEILLHYALWVDTEPAQLPTIAIRRVAFVKHVDLLAKLRRTDYGVFDRSIRELVKVVRFAERHDLSRHKGLWSEFRLQLSRLVPQKSNTSGKQKASRTIERLSEILQSDRTA